MKFLVFNLNLVLIYISGVFIYIFSKLILATHVIGWLVIQYLYGTNIDTFFWIL